MTENETNGTEAAKAKTYEGVAVRLIDNPPNGTVDRDIRVKGTDKKFIVVLPIPTNDEEAMEWYNKTIEQLLAKGVKQHSYDSDGDVRNLLETKTAAGEDPADYADEFRAEFTEALKAEKQARAKGGKAKAERETGKKAGESAQKAGLTPDQMFEVLDYISENPSATMSEAKEALGY